MKTAERPLKHLNLFLSIALILLGLLSISCSGRDSVRLMFWNVENFMYPTDNPLTKDDPYIFNDWIGYTEKAYLHKLENISSVLNSMSPTLAAFAEIEDMTVLKDLRSQLHHSESWQILHRDSPDRRGIDTALLYRSDRLELVDKSWVESKLDSDVPSRDILLATFRYQGYIFNIIVLHWPSRYGKGEGHTLRMSAAEQLSQLVNTEYSDSGNPLILTGDFNAELKDPSLQYLLSSLKTMAGTQQRRLLTDKHSQPVKSYWYRGEWKHYDHFILSTPIQSKLCFTASGIYWRRSMLHDEGEGPRPFRFISSRRIIGGFSDHLPVYIDCYLRNENSLR